MKISEYQRGYQDAARQMITWLHEEAASIMIPTRADCWMVPPLRSGFG